MRLAVSLLVLLALATGLVPPCERADCAERIETHQDAQDRQKGSDECADACLQCCYRFVATPAAIVLITAVPPATLDVAEPPSHFDRPPASIWHPPRV